MNWLLRIFGMRDDPPASKPCPTCGARIPIPVKNYYSLGSEQGIHRAYIDGVISLAEMEEALGRASVVRDG